MKAFLRALKNGLKKVASAAKKLFVGGKEKTVEFAKGPGKNFAGGVKDHIKSYAWDWMMMVISEKILKICMEKVAEAMHSIGRQPQDEDYDNLFETQYEKTIKFKQKWRNFFAKQAAQ